jgi:uncharacterized protein YjbI with pentapeptide repeats
MASGLLIGLAAPCQADIYRWDNGQLIPGTEGITPGRGGELDHRNLEFAELNETDLTDARFDSSNLTRARFFSATLTNSNLSAANLTEADLGNANFTNAKFDGAVVNGADFGSTNLTQEQLYSTDSYKARDLRGVGLSYAVNPCCNTVVLPANDLTGWNFRGQDLTGARFGESTLANADFSGAIVAGAGFGATTTGGFTKEQLYSTASYQAKDLRGVGLGGNNLAGWDFGGQDLTGAGLGWSDLTAADFEHAIVSGAHFNDAIAHGFRKEQLYSTASYRAKDLSGIDLGGIQGAGGNDLTDWDFSDQDLTGASFFQSEVANANFEGATVTWTNLGWAYGFTKEQLYSTASYQAKDLRGMTFLFYSDERDWNFIGQNLMDASFPSWDVFNSANFEGADLRAVFDFDDNFRPRNAILHDGSIAGLELLSGDILRVRDDDGIAPAPNRWFTRRSTIAVTTQDNLTMTDGGVLELIVEADSWDSLISFEPGIPVQLGGMLELTFADDIDLSSQVGRTLRIFDWTGISPSGHFTIQSPYVWDLTNLYTTGEVTLIAVPEPAVSSPLVASALALAASCRLAWLKLRH